MKNIDKFKTYKREVLIPKIENKKIAYACLNWGMGHLTRSISILKELSLSNSVVFYGSPNQIEFLKNEKIPVSYQEFTDYRLNFSGKSFLAEMIFQSPRMIQDIQIENKNLNELHQKENFDLIISDNRFGFRLEQVHSIILTHQLKIKSPLFEKQGSSLNQIYLNKFDEIWVPDTKESTFSGELSQVQMKTPVHFIGNISDLKPSRTEKSIEILIIATGPEPYKTDFIQCILKKLESYNFKTKLVGASDSTQWKSKNIEIENITDRKSIEKLINQSQFIISKTGYTTILDLDKMNAKALLIPTPKQYEQEYLAQLHSNKPNLTICTEKEFKLIDLQQIVH